MENFEINFVKNNFVSAKSADGIFPAKANEHESSLNCIFSEQSIARAKNHLRAFIADKSIFTS